ncbi:MAG: efflux transporter outer membrane subunit, partial [Chlamydiia bacterium]|nr:efflux transporter outer membrane subunit [Chlamydiia bacterium]
PPGLQNFPDEPYRIHLLGYLLPINLSYEVDLWGKHRNRAKAGCLSAWAQLSAYKSALLTLTTEVASTYYTLKTLEATALIYQDEIQQRQEALSFFSSRYDKGIGQKLDVETSKIELANTEAAYADTKREIALQNHRLAALIGRAPETFCLAPLESELSPPMIPAGVPTDILVNRPDISEAELKRTAENARVGAAKAEFFPSFTLTGALGYLSPTTQDFLSYQSRLWSMGANADQTLFDGFRKYQNYQASWARFDQADSNYRQLVLNAFKEVEDALASLRYEREKKEKYLIAQEASMNSLSLSKSRYSRGITNRLEVIDNQRSTLAARLNHLNAAGATWQATLQLIRALGGSWGDICDKTY